MDLGIFIFTLFAFPNFVQTACKIYPRKLEVGKKASLDCPYDGIRIPYGQTHLDMDKCMECTCQLSGPLECCHIDHAPQVVEVEGCVAKQVNCQTVLVDATNEDKPCEYPTREVINTDGYVTSQKSNTIGSDDEEKSGFLIGGNGARSLSAKEYMLLLEIALSLLMQRDF
ncbi:hypothetical protein FSP39_021922 [Pinctada imbricata]|uniref:VWFC domain-containing protein n=1 Tax=Pinctada imbricata TaxID=66713 RepID=A0AA88YSA7_PINIB|nr:hypothetical protein FSP39_021922 [Pinctada imbricata]